MALLISVVVALASGATPTAAEVVRYVLRGLTLFGAEHRLTGAFAANPYPLAVNGPLWSLQYEVAAYVICYAASRVPWGSVLVLALVLTLAPGLPGRLEVFAPLLLAFAFGMVAWRLRGWTLLTGPALALTVLVAVVSQNAALETLAFCHAVLMVAYRLPAITLPADLSFGLYIYGWTVAQALMMVEPDLTPPALALATLLCTLPLAWASWTLVEHPVLHRRALA